MRTFRRIGMAVMAIALCFNFAACSDDDDDEGISTPNEEVSIITTDDGDNLLLTSIGNDYEFEYDNQGRCTYMSGEYGFYNISYDPFSISYVDKGDDTKGYINLSFTSEGYIKSWAHDYYYEDDFDGSESGTEKINFSYDNSGHLTTISCSYSYKNTTDGETESGSGSTVQTLSWSNGNLTEVKCSDKGTEGSYTYTSDETYTFTTGSTANKYNQYSLAEAEFLDLIESAVGGDVFAYIGMFGKASDYLPESYTYNCREEEDGDEYNETESYTTSYTLNSDGTIESESITSYSCTVTYDYTYGTLGSSSSSTRAAYTRAYDSVTAKQQRSLRRLSRRARHQSAE